MAPAKKWNETVAELKLSLMDDGAALNPDVASMLLTTAGDCFESNEDDNDMASSSQVHYDIVKWIYSVKSPNRLNCPYLFTINTFILHHQSNMPFVRLTQK